MTAPYGPTAADGSTQVTVLASGTTQFPRYAANGSINVSTTTQDAEYGIFDPGGNLVVKVCTSDQKSLYASDGSLNVSETPYYYNTLKVTAVSGSLSGGGGGGGGNTGIPMGLLLSLTYSS